MSFARTLRNMAKKAKASPYELSQASGLDYTHLRNLMSGKADRPTRYTIVRLAQGLSDLSGAMNLDDVDRLLNSAGKGPLRRERIVLPNT